ncbi:MAG: hypothetical protein AAGG68_14140 [Bacteroidota bacterium]
MKQTLTTLLLCFCLFLAYSKDEPSIFNYFQREQILNLTFETDLGQLIKKKSRENYQEASLTYLDLAGVEQVKNIKVRARGNSRKSTCYYPPLKLKFAKDALQAAGLRSDFNKLKLVCQCRKGEAYEQYLIKEYLAYRMFNELSPMSFRVQLVAIHYVDHAQKIKPFTSYGFLIEPAKELAARFEGTPYRSSVLNPKYTLPEQTNLLYLFQYMIGNTDWAIANNHNVFSFRTYRYSLPVCVPYDFDYAGMVNTVYAVPNENLPIKNVTQRLFRGICRSAGTYESVAQLFIQKKGIFYQIIEENQELNFKSKRWMNGYLDEFFGILERPRSFQQAVIGYCRGK